MGAVSRRPWWWELASRGPGGGSWLQEALVGASFRRPSFSCSEVSFLPTIPQVNEAEEERLRSEREHQRVTQLCQDAEARVQNLQKALKKVIVKSKPYFELKVQFNYILEVRSSSARWQHDVMF